MTLTTTPSIEPPFQTRSGPEPHLLLTQWLNGIKIAHVAHSRAAASYRLRGQLLGVPVTVFTVVIGTSVFTTLHSSPNERIIIMIGVTSVLAAVLSGVQTFLNYPEQAARHQAAGTKYGRLRRRVEEVISWIHDSQDLK